MCSVNIEPSSPLQWHHPVWGPGVLPQWTPFGAVHPSSAGARDHLCRPTQCHRRGTHQGSLLWILVLQYVSTRSLSPSSHRHYLPSILPISFPLSLPLSCVQLGITEEGARRAILEGVVAIHKKKWHMPSAPIPVDVSLKWAALSTQELCNHTPIWAVGGSVQNTLVCEQLACCAQLQTSWVHCCLSFFLSLCLSLTAQCKGHLCHSLSSVNTYFLFKGNCFASVTSDGGKP